ncbi:MAG: hypothetical protein ACK4WH_04425 [Phycisphaerales bacterium]
MRRPVHRPTGLGERGVTAARRCAAALSLVAALTVGGCGRDKPAAGPPGVSEPAQEIRRSNSTGEVGPDGAPMLEVTIVLERDRITTADRLPLRVRISGSAGARREWAAPRETLGEWQVAETARREVVGEGGASVVEHLLVLEPFLDGAKTIPPMTFRYSPLAGGAWRTLVTEPIEVTVGSVLGEGEERESLAGAKPPAAVVVEDGFNRWALGAAAGAGVLGYAGAFVAAHARARRRGREADPVRIALQRLAALEGRLRGDTSGGSADPADAAELASIVRAYLSALCGRDLRGLLADELAQAVRGRARGGADAAPFVEVVKALDAGRFGPARLGVRTLEARVAEVAGLVQQSSAAARASGGAGSGVAA